MRDRREVRRLVVFLLVVAAFILMILLGGNGSGGGDGGGDMATPNARSPLVEVTYHLPPSVRQADRERWARYDTRAVCGTFRASVAGVDQKSQHYLVWWAQGIEAQGEYAPRVLMSALHRLELDVVRADPGTVAPGLASDLAAVQTTCTRLRS